MKQLAEALDRCIADGDDMCCFYAWEKELRGLIKGLRESRDAAERLMGFEMSVGMAEQVDRILAATKAADQHLSNRAEGDK